MIEQLKRFALIGISTASCLFVITLAASSLNVDMTSKQMIMVYAVILVARGLKAESVKQEALNAVDSIIVAACADIVMRFF